ncbi:MAG TPA: D-alanyl-D-alanine carboxypeptidase family protein, partial [Beijerinckiaceae bacterium]|nr:D-alanyl-D-alanine carboxypeptidase family protein [Beijerinckiaceae bacterium]
MTGARFLGGLIALGLTLGVPAAHAAPSSPELVIDVATGQVLLADEATRPWFPASTTKMMTAYVVLRAVKAGELKLETPLIASAKAAAQPPSKIGIRPGQEITVDNALKILMVKSANDLAQVIAEGVGGSQEAFAQRMNAEAARLGMRDSHFVNPHGLFHAAQVSSARDLAILGRAMLVEFPEYRDYWGIGAVQLGQRVMKNTNGLIGRYPGAEGMKTGFICPSGFNVVATASRGGRTLLAVILGAGSGAERSIRTAQILDRGFASSAWAPSLGSVTTLPPSGHASAPNMRQDICGRGRQVAFEEEDTGKAISLPITATGDNASVYAIMTPSPMPGASSSVGGKNASGRAVLGPRAELPPILVHLGRGPGNT